MTMAEWAVFVAVVIGGIAWAVNRYLELTGKSPSARILREENQDLVRRNHDLGSEVARLEKDVDVMRVQIRTLETLVEDLRGRDQAAVLSAIEQHEVNAGTRNVAVLSVLTEIRDAVKAA